MSALAKLTATEAKLLLRDPGGPISILGIPLGLLVVFGIMPGNDTPKPEYGGSSALSAVIAPMAVALLLGMLGLMFLPMAMATHREKGVLKRLSASPVAPSRLLAAQLLVTVGAAIAVIVIVVVVGRIALGLGMPSSPVNALISVVLGGASLFSIGLVVAAVVPTGRAGAGIGYATFFPMLALGGVWVPKDQLPGALQTVADILPLGAALTSLRDAWTGNGLHVLPLVSMTVITVVCTALAARLFRWE
ncbi:ABC-2 type transport system permease protein [Amycolatopsis xylanica]|uniref:Transport permease protein n=1 Tax=Amycolatopsis xylanica TaxID=589385 RepID=A0A1H3S0V1_9PSEU|nr:ABC transporter permease [Amycolatopsis xylanica]SDZ31407.1 ABC-2 type transport system permease protein [Amycolatopsis xylanica]